MFPDEQPSCVSESKRLLEASPQRHGWKKRSPYHTGQLHPAVRVGDLLQHINDMSTGEGYGFQQEYEVSGSHRTKTSVHVSNSRRLWTLT